MEDLSGAVGKSLTSDQFKGIGSKYFGNADLPAGDYSVGGYKYNVADNGNGTRTINGGTDFDLNSVGGSATDFAKGLNSTEDAAFKEYLMAARAQGKPLDIYNALETAAGLPQMRTTASSLRSAVGDIEDTIKRIEPNVSATTRDSLVTEGQRRNMVSSQKLPFLERLGEVGTSLGRVEQGISAAESGIGTKVGLALQGNQQELEPYKVQMSMLADRNARSMTGFTADREVRLNALQDKLNRDRQLDDREWLEASDLSKLQLQFDNEKRQMEDKFNYDLKLKEAAKKTSFAGGGAVFSDDPYASEWEWQ